MMPTLPVATASPLERFRVFYASVAELRRQVQDGAWPPLDSGTALEAVQGPLLNLLRRLAETSETDAVDPVARQARYLMTAFADDLFTRLEWPLSEAWSASPLEWQLFQTDEAASVVFDRIEKLLGIGDPGQRELARLYLMALALGFRGKYREDPEGSLGRYRERLLAFAVPGAPQTGDDSLKLSPDAYQHTMAPIPGRLLPNVRRWAFVAMVVVALVGVLSFPLWRGATRSINTAVENVLNR